MKYIILILFLMPIPEDFRVDPSATITEQSMSSCTMSPQSGSTGQNDLVLLDFVKDKYYSPEHEQINDRYNMPVRTPEELGATLFTATPREKEVVVKHEDLPKATATPEFSTIRLFLIFFIFILIYYLCKELKKI